MVKIQNKTFVISVSPPLLRLELLRFSSLTHVGAAAPSLPPAGGLGAIGGCMAREIIAQGGYVAVFDILPQEKGELLVRDSLSADRAWYFQTNIADEESVKAACDGTLAAAPKGSLAGLVHCAAASKSRPWTQKMARSIADFKVVVNVNVIGTFIVNAYFADALNSQYPDQAADLPARVTEERGIIINIASAAATPNARVLTYGVRAVFVLCLAALSDDAGTDLAASPSPAPRRFLPPSRSPPRVSRAACLLPVRPPATLQC